VIILKKGNSKTKQSFKSFRKNLYNDRAHSFTLSQAEQVKCCWRTMQVFVFVDTLIFVHAWTFSFSFSFINKLTEALLDQIKVMNVPCLLTSVFSSTLSTNQNGTWLSVWNKKENVNQRLLSITHTSRS